MVRQRCTARGQAEGNAKGQQADAPASAGAIKLLVLGALQHSRHIAIGPPRCSLHRRCLLPPGEQGTAIADFGDALRIMADVEISAHDDRRIAAGRSFDEGAKGLHLPAIGPVRTLNANPGCCARIEMGIANHHGPPDTGDPHKGQQRAFRGQAVVTRAGIGWKCHPARGENRIIGQDGKSAVHPLAIAFTLQAAGGGIECSADRRLGARRDLRCVRAERNMIVPGKRSDPLGIIGEGLL